MLESQKVEVLLPKYNEADRGPAVGGTLEDKFTVPTNQFLNFRMITPTGAFPLAWWQAASKEGFGGTEVPAERMFTGGDSSAKELVLIQHQCRSGTLHISQSCYVRHPLIMVIYFCENQLDSVTS
jgi:hypothetical protein